MRHLTPAEREISYKAMEKTGSQPNKTKELEQKKETNDSNTKIVYMA